MEIAEHLKKIARYEDLMGRLDKVEDFELRVWASMNAATNALNAVLHHLGVTDPGNHFPHQIPGIYVEPKKKNGTWRKVIVLPGDVIHIGFPPIKAEIPEAVAHMMAPLHIIEGIRESHIRGDAAITSDLASRCEKAYEACMSHARSILSGPSGGR